MLDDLPETAGGATTPAGAAPVPETYDPASDEAAGLAAYKAAVAENTTETPPAVVEAAAVEPAAIESPASEPGDAKIEKLFTRVSAMEAERATERAELEKLRSENAEFKSVFDDYNKNPDKVFKRMNWSQETIRDYIMNGENAPSVVTTALEAKLEAKLKALEERISSQTKDFETQRNDVTKAAIPGIITESAFPHTFAFFDSPAVAAEHVWGLMEHARREQKLVLTPEEAASAVERQLAKQAERLSKVSKQTNPGSAAPAPKQITPKPTNATTQASTTAPYNPEEHTDAENLAHAEEIMRGARAK